MENVWIHVFRADAKRIVRDRFLLLVTTYLPLLALVFRWAVPAVAEALRDTVDISPYYPPLCAVFVLMLPFAMGLVLGLQLLEEKDEKSLSAVAITPFSLQRYFLFRFVTYATVGTVMMVASHEVLGIVRSISLLQLCALAPLFALNAALTAFIAPVVAKNQVQGFAVLKGAGFLFILPVFGFFVPPNWDLFLGVLPFYWPIKAYYIAVLGGSPAFFLTVATMAIVTQTVALVFLYRIFRRRVLEV